MKALAADLQLEEFVQPEDATEVISSKDFREGRWQQLAHLRNAPAGVRKTVIPVDVSYVRFLVVSKVEPGTMVTSHAHDEPIVRYITTGRLTLNGQPFEAGEWMVVPRGVDYHIETDAGYTAVAGYGVACE